ncbi:DUF916 and DUF3324 domain-containing protein [Carnobacterium divergens]|uniref:DUF916 and DUF3324 domain-containing protein n=1 Tax=Carnobacterium divergens TaxID=2748 RepID=UPI0039C9DA4B
MKKYNLIAMLLVVLLAFNYQIADSLAADKGMSFSVSAIHPENQISQETSYFDLKMKPGQEEEIQVMMNNATDKEITVEVGVNSAITNNNGVLDYSWNLENVLKKAKENNKDKTKDKIDLKKIAYDSTLKYPIPTITTSKKEVKIPAKSELPYTIKIKMPEEAFDGILLGGLRFTEKENTNDKSEGKKGVQIENKFAYVIGLILQETDNKVTPNLELNRNKIAPASLNGRNAVTINLQNTEMIMMRDFEVDAKIYKKNGKEILHQSSNKSLKMAPNSNFNYAVDWENQPLKAGQYLLKLHAKNQATTDETKEMNQEWNFSEEFRITTDEAKKINEKAVELVKEPISWWIYGLIGLVLFLLLLLIISLIKRYRAKKKKEARRRAMKKKKQNAFKKQQKRKNEQKFKS